jgi:multidrug efflux pump subunit AcrA (membrane-fusion protein)
VSPAIESPKDPRESRRLSAFEEASIMVEPLRPVSPPPDSEGGLRAPPGLSWLGRAWWWFHFLVLVKLARLRFLAILAAIGLVILKWETVNAYYEKWTRTAAPEAPAGADIEYFSPMHPQIVRDQPGQCPICGMNLVPRPKKKPENKEAWSPGAIDRVQLSPYRVAQAGLKTWEVTAQSLTREIRTVGFVEFDERKLARITSWLTDKSRLTKLYANVTGQRVQKGDPLAEVYSPELVVTLQTLLSARRAGDADLLRDTRERLRQWGLSDDQIDDVLKTGRAAANVTIRSPISGYVVKKYQVEGAYVEQGARLYDVADLSTVWIEAQVYEDDLNFLEVGLDARAEARAFPGRAFEGKLSFIQPHLDARSRTVKVRFDMPNAGLELRPGMYARVTIRLPAERSLAVPESAVIDTGSRKFVYREVRPGVYDSVEVQLGLRGGDFYPVASGLKAGDKVVTAGSFLVDAESRMSTGRGLSYGKAGPPSETEDKLLAEVAKLGRADQALAQRQRFCAVNQGSRLGSMGVPFKLLLDGRPVFLCCESCEAEARAHPDQTLTGAERLKANQHGGHHHD